MTQYQIPSDKIWKKNWIERKYRVFQRRFWEIIERFCSSRDLGVQMCKDANFTDHVENICNKVRNRCGWISRTFYWKERGFMKHMFNTLLQPHIDYCSQLWMPQEGLHLEKVENLLRDITWKIPGLQELTYWERPWKWTENKEDWRDIKSYMSGRLWRA